MEDPNFIPCKLPLCMICVSPITTSEEEPLALDTTSPNKTISKEVFLRGIDILSNNLSLEDGYRFGKEEEWTRELGTKENFVGSVCCGKCGEVVRSLVELQDLIRETEVKLKENVNLVELSVVNSVGLAEGVEYSIGTCLRFREEVLKGFQNRNQDLKIEDKASKNKKKKLTEKKARPLSVRLRQQAILKDEALVNLPEVKVERLSGDNRSLSKVSTVPDQDDVNDPDESYYPTNDIDDEVNFDEEEEEEFRPNYKYRGSLDQFGRKRKRGRPPKHPQNAKGKQKLDDDGLIPAKRRRGRPRKEERAHKEEEIIQDDFDIDISMPMNHASEDQQDVDWAPENVPECSSEDDNDDQEDIEYCPEEEKEPPKRKRGRPKKGKGPRITRLDDPFNDRRTCKKVDKLLNNDSPYYLKPFLDIGGGMLSYLNCKIQLEGNRLVCKHPDCYYESVFEYFTTFHAFRDMRFHVKMEHRKKKSPEEDDRNASFYCCVYCDAHFEKRFFMIQHIKTEHPTASPLPSLCEVCGMSLPHSELLDHVFTHKSEDEKQFALEMQTSVGTHPGKTKDPTLPMEFPCDKCDQVFDNHTRLRIHARTHVPIELRRQFQCDRCPEKLQSLNGLRLHMKTVHLKDEQPRPYVCNICGKTYIKQYKEKYEIHMRMHSGEKPFQCAECGKGFREKYRLKQHEQLHVDMQIPCEYCSKTYRAPKYLRRHHYKHHPELVKLPDKKVTQKYANLEHTNAYYGPKLMYPCEPCGKIYVYKSQLIPHLKHAHKIFYPKSSDYPNMLTMEDTILVKNSRNRGPKSSSSSSTPASSRPHSNSSVPQESLSLAEYAHQFQGLGHGSNNSLYFR